MRGRGRTASARWRGRGSWSVGSMRRMRCWRSWVRREAGREAERGAGGHWRRLASQVHSGRMPSNRVVSIIGIAALVGAGAVAVACGSASDAHRKRGLGYARDGKTQDAIEELRLAIAAEPRDRAAHAALGRLELKAGR